MIAPALRLYCDDPTVPADFATPEAASPLFSTQPSWGDDLPHLAPDPYQLGLVFPAHDGEILAHGCDDDPYVWRHHERLFRRCVAWRALDTAVVVLHRQHEVELVQHHTSLFGWGVRPVGETSLATHSLLPVMHPPRHRQRTLLADPHSWHSSTRTSLAASTIPPTETAFARAHQMVGLLPWPVRQWVLARAVVPLLFEASMTPIQRRDGWGGYQVDVLRLNAGEAVAVQACYVEDLPVWQVQQWHYRFGDDADRPAAPPLAPSPGVEDHARSYTPQPQHCHPAWFGSLYPRPQ